MTIHNSSNEQQKNGIFSASIHRWRTQLVPEEISISQHIAKRELAWMGYLNVDISPELVDVLGGWLKTPVALLKALHANREVAGPLMPYLAKRIGALLGVNR